jgi:hypothetical protein
MVQYLDPWLQLPLPSSKLTLTNPEELPVAHAVPVYIAEIVFGRGVYHVLMQPFLGVSVVGPEVWVVGDWGHVFGDAGIIVGVFVYVSVVIWARCWVSGRMWRREGRRREGRRDDDGERRGSEAEDVGSANVLMTMKR